MTISSRWPGIVAEALRDVATFPPPTGMVPELVAPAAAHHHWTGAMTPDADGGPPPAFLHADQIGAWRRATATLARYRAVLLAEPVGHGKTWIALALAAGRARGALVLAPAVLLPQWRAAAAAAGIALRAWSHERLSRGRLPPDLSGLVIIDEAHRFRHATTRRVRTLAPALPGCRVVLLTATPIVNRAHDLSALLHLALPEDALALDGIDHLSLLGDRHIPPAALRRLVLRGRRDTVEVVRDERILTPGPAEERRGERAATTIAALALSRRVPIRRLLRVTLLDAAASSDAAFLSALGRYRALLRHAADGAADRAMIRRFAGGDLAQTVFWSMVPASPGPGDLSLDDLPLLDRALDRPPDDGAWIDALRAIMADAIPTVLLCRHRASAEALRRALGPGAAWVIGSEGGIGPHRIPRSAVLAAFGPAQAGRSPGGHPTSLVATDVVAEGLDLQGAGRLVHVDLPWTAVRRDQREGRLLRRGQRHAAVEIVRRRAPFGIEAALHRETIVSRKGEVARRWLDHLATDDAGARRDGFLTTSVAAPHEADVVLLRLRRGTRDGLRALHRRTDGAWSEIDPDDPPFGVEATPAVIPHPLGTALATARAAMHWIVGRPDPAPSLGSGPLVLRIHRLARDAARRRDADALRRLDRLLRWAIAGTTLGDRMRRDELLRRDDRALLAADVPDHPALGPLTVTPLVVVLFRSPDDRLRCPA